jgi:hypothetical protein
MALRIGTRFRNSASNEGAYQYTLMRSIICLPSPLTAARACIGPGRRRHPEGGSEPGQHSVQLFATRSGGLVGNLNKDDFKVFEDGKEQEVKYFNRETDLPLTIGLLIDVSASQMNLIEIEKNAAYQFFGSVLRKQDLAFLISFGEDSELLQDYTNSPKLLRAGLDGLQVSSGVGGFGPARYPPFRSRAGLFCMTRFTWHPPINSRDRWDARFWC